MKIANANGIETKELAIEWGTAVSPKQIEEATFLANETPSIYLFKPVLLAAIEPTFLPGGAIIS